MIHSINYHRMTKLHWCLWAVVFDVPKITHCTSPISIYVFIHIYIYPSNYTHWHTPQHMIQNQDQWCKKPTKKWSKIAASSFKSTIFLLSIFHPSFLNTTQSISFNLYELSLWSLTYTIFQPQLGSRILKINQGFLKRFNLYMF